MTGEKISDLIRLLGSDDPRESKSAGEALLELGEPALPYITSALRNGSATVRKAAAFLAGRMGKNEEAEAALQNALSDEEPKVRKNAAVSLGRLRSQTSLGQLRNALNREKVAWVRPSMVLAIGMIGGSEARAAFQDVIPQSDVESEAMRKALFRTDSPPSAVQWRANAGVLADVFATSPVGLEDVSAEEAVSCGLGRPDLLRPGLLRFDRTIHLKDIMPRLRCVYDARVLLARGPSLKAFAKGSGGDGGSGLASTIATIVQSAKALTDWSSWISAETPLGYRFSLQEIRVPESAFKETLRRLRAELTPLGLEDRPTNYSFELIVEAGRESTDLWLKPSFEPDRRFAYRKTDVGASINPVVAACLARLVRTSASGVVFDPTCGSATLLIERSLLDPGICVRGLDVSPTAVRAARENITASRISHALIEHGDASDPRYWKPCREVIANLPFGVRTRIQDRDLVSLYLRVVENTASSLEFGGRALFYTANAAAIGSALARKPQLTMLDHRTVNSGGLRVSLFLATKRKDNRRAQVGSQCARRA